MHRRQENKNANELVDTRHCPPHHGLPKGALKKVAAAFNVLENVLSNHSHFAAMDRLTLRGVLGEFCEVKI